MCTRQLKTSLDGKIVEAKRELGQLEGGLSEAMQSRASLDSKVNRFDLFCIIGNDGIRVEKRAKGEDGAPRIS